MQTDSAHGHSSPANGLSHDRPNHSAGRPATPAANNPIEQLLQRARRVKNPADLGIGVEIKITGGPHRDWDTGVITGTNGRHWMIVGTGTRLAKNLIPFVIEACYVAPL